MKVIFNCCECECFLLLSLCVVLSCWLCVCACGYVCVHACAFLFFEREVFISYLITCLSQFSNIILCVLLLEELRHLQHLPCVICIVWNRSAERNSVLLFMQIQGLIWLGSIKLVLELRWLRLDLFQIASVILCYCKHSFIRLFISIFSCLCCCVY